MRSQSWCPQGSDSNWGYAGVETIYEGIDYLNGIGAPGVDPGPRVCARVSCSYNAAIFWCNDVSSSRLSQTLKEPFPQHSLLEKRTC
jgi:hypothetical protein